MMCSSATRSDRIWGDDVIELGIYVPESRTTHMFTLALDGRQTDNGVPITGLTVVTSTIAGWLGVGGGDSGYGVRRDRSGGEPAVSLQFRAVGRRSVQLPGPDPSVLAEQHRQQL